MAAYFLSLGGTSLGPGASEFFSSGLTHTALTVSSIGCLLSSIMVDNTMNAAITYIQFFNDVIANVTVGATTPTFSIPVKGSDILNIPFPLYGLDFGKGLVIAATTTVAGSTAPATAPLNITLNIYGNINTPITLAVDNT